MINKWTQECLHCQTSKIHTHIKAPLEEFKVPSKRFSHIHVDLVGPLPPSDGFTHLFTVIDRTTRWPEVIPLKNTTTKDCAHALIHGWISRYGTPLDITSDRGPQFTSSLWSEIATSLGVQIHRTTAYHPQSNGLVERFHRSLKTSIKTRLQSPNWINELPWVMLGLRTAPKEDLGLSSAELVFGEALTVPGEFIPSDTSPWDANHFLQTTANRLSNGPQTAQKTSLHRTLTTHMPISLQNAKFVFVRIDAHRGPLQRPYSGPYEVVKPGTKTFVIKMGGRDETVSVDRLKPAHIDGASHMTPLGTRRRGRPPSSPNIDTGPSQPSTRTSSGRVIHKPSRFG